MNPEQFVTIQTFHSQMEAELARMHLEQEGIRAVLTNVEGTAVWGGTMGGIRLQVPADQVDAAAALLAWPHNGPDPGDAALTDL